MHKVHLMNEFTVEWPLWGGIHGTERTRPSEWPLSEDLVARILDWASFFSSHYTWRVGWADCADERSHRIAAQQLARRLREELGPEFDVELRLWECDPTPLRR